MSAAASVFSYFRGTRADLKPGDLTVVGYRSNFTDAASLSWVYLSGTLDAAIWGRSWPSAMVQDAFTLLSRLDRSLTMPNLTNKKFPGNPSLSYRSRDPLRMVAEVIGWQGHSPELLQQMKDNVVRSLAEGATIID